MIDFGYEGKNCVVTGAASGIGKAVAQMINEQGANIFAVDLNEIDYQAAKFIKTDLADKASIDACLAKLPQKIDSIFSCAGVAGLVYAGKTFDAVDVVKINFVSAHYLIESLIPRMDSGGAIGLVSSIGGMKWRKHLKEYILPFLSIDSYENKIAWLKEHRDNHNIFGEDSNSSRSYEFSKECLTVYAKTRAWSLAAKEIRINTTSPGSTATPLLADFIKSGGSDVETFDHSKTVSPIARSSTAEEQARALIYLNSAYADYISGCDLVVDYGYSTRFIDGGRLQM